MSDNWWDYEIDELDRQIGRSLRGAVAGEIRLGHKNMRVGLKHYVNYDALPLAGKIVYDAIRGDSEVFAERHPELVVIWDRMNAELLENTIEDADNADCPGRE